MTLTLGIRLVIILPTLLFLVGFTFKALIEAASIERCIRGPRVERKLGANLARDFILVLAIDATFLFVANGLILIFQFQKVETGIIALIGGLILSMCIQVSIYTLVEQSFPMFIFGFLGTFGLLSGELVYFSTYEIMSHSKIAFIVGFLVGVLIGLYVSYLAFVDAIKLLEAASKRQETIKQPR